MTLGLLVDVTKCMGCRACMVACKRWHDRPAEATTLSPDWTNPPDVSASTWVTVKFSEIGEGDDFKWRFAQWRCMHCDDPTCAYVCPTTALRKMESGPVVYDEDLCIGCRYCVVACPFHIPKFNWDTRKIEKCNLCFDRLEAGLKPACVESCPPRALEFGDLDELISKAEAKAARIGGYVYGKEEAGGTSVIYVSDVPPAQLGLPAEPRKIPISVLTRDTYTSVAGVGIVGAVAIGGLWYYSTRRRRVEERASEEKAKKVT